VVNSEVQNPALSPQNGEHFADYYLLFGEETGCDCSHGGLPLA
jgi:hypothetical protein